MAGWLLAQGENHDNTSPQKPGFWLACLPIALTFVVLGVQLFYFGNFTPTCPWPWAWPLPR
ncbi:hypothetical protein MBH78_18250 [Oceanimonas sp. NS1]|nr:hypothetical protein [Oceanimonas sp. NS1]